MSLEESIDALRDRIEDLIGVIEQVSFPGIVVEAPDSVGGILEFDMTDVSNLSVEVGVKEDDTIVEAVSADSLALISLAKELGLPYLQEGEKIVVDNRVLDEYNRRRLGDNL